MDTKLPSGTHIEFLPDSDRIMKALVQESWSLLKEGEFRSYQRLLSDWHEGEITLPGSPYHEAVGLIRGGETSAAAIARALGSDAPDGEEGNVWALFDRRHATRLPVSEMPEFKEQGTAWEAAEDAKGDGEEDPPTREPLTATMGRVVFLAKVHGREILRWTRSGAPVHSYRKDGPVFDLEALVEWMDTVEGSLDDKRRVGRGRPQIGDLVGPRRRLIAAVNRFREKEIELREGEAEAKAVKAAALLEVAAAEIGWSGIEALTGLMHHPRAGRSS
ncbi:hypothetical protein [Methylobacterium sp. SD21]|uniref:hypothetical protein n=1 Tax=Methylobacterium litchii TaxID=3138810 RepID=UPI00313AF565